MALTTDNTELLGLLTVETSSLPDVHVKVNSVSKSKALPTPFCQDSLLMTRPCMQSVVVTQITTFPYFSCWLTLLLFCFLLVADWLDLAELKHDIIFPIGASEL